jgi:hypothetical protein
MCIDQETRTIYVFGGQTLINLSSTGLPIPPTAAAAIEGISSIQIKLFINHDQPCPREKTCF